MKTLIGWRVFYDDGQELSSQDRDWKSIPMDGVLAVVEYYDDGTKQVHHNKDYYVLDDGKAFATNDIRPYLAKLGTVKMGRWSKDSLFNKILAKADTSTF